MKEQFAAVSNAIGAGQLDMASQLLLGMPQKAAATPLYHILTGQIAMRQKHFDAALLALQKAAEQGGNEITILAIRAQIHSALHDHAAWRDACLRLSVLEPGNPARHQALAGAHLAAQDLTAQDLAAALQANQTAQDLGARDMPLLWQRAAILEAMKARDAADPALPAALAEVLGLLAEQAAGDVAHQIRLATLQARHGLMPDALASARRICAAAPRLVRGYELALNFAVQPQDISQVLDQALAQCDEAPVFRSINFKLVHVSVAESDRLIAALCAKWPQMFNPRFGRGGFGAEAQQDEFLTILRSASTLGKAQALTRVGAFLARVPQPPTLQLTDLAREVIAALPEPGSFRRDLIVDDGEDMVVSPPGDSGVTVLGFCGLGQMLGYDITLIDGILASHGAAAVYLRDSRLNLFLDGLRCLGPTRAASVAALRPVLAGLGTRRLVVLTSSGGGLGGVAWALDLAADRILSMSSPTAMTPEVFAAGGMPGGAALTQRFAAAFAPGDLDLLPRLQAAGTGLDLRMCYGADNRFDRIQAERVAGVPGVTLHPVAGWAVHNVFPTALASATFERLLFA